MARTKRLTVLGESSIKIGDRCFSYTIKRSPRLRHVRIELRPYNGITVVIPPGCDVKSIPCILKSRQDWLLSRLARYEHLLPSTPAPVKDGDTIPYLGNELRLVVYRDREAAGIRQVQDKMEVSLNSGEVSLPWLLEQWFRFHAARLLTEKVKDFSSRMNLSYKRITIRGQRTRWGSCSHCGNLSFNWKLAMVPESVIDYVVTHELIHLKEMNHSKRFWELVARHCPDWRKHRKWLKDNDVRLNEKFQSIRTETI